MTIDVHLKPALAIGLLLTTVAVPAAADSFPVCDREPTASDVEAAKGMHKAAEQYYAKAQYEKAIERWSEAYSFDCTAHRLLINIGNAHEKLGATKNAIEAFEAYISRLGADADTTIVEKVENLRELASKEPDPPPKPDPAPPKPPPKPDPGPDAGAGIAPWIVVGAGGVVAVVGGVLLGVGISKESAAEDACPNRGDGEPCPDDIASDGNLGITLQQVGGVGLAVGLVGAAGGVIWWALALPTDEPAAASIDLGPIDVQPDVGFGPGYGSLGLRGTF